MLKRQKLSHCRHIFNIICYFVKRVILKEFQREIPIETIQMIDSFSLLQPTGTIEWRRALLNNFFQVPYFPTCSGTVLLCHIVSLYSFDLLYHYREDIQTLHCARTRSTPQQHSKYTQPNHLPCRVLPASS